MSQQFLGEIRAVGFNFPPSGWAMCNGQLLAISNYTALFSLLGTIYGGDGVTTFALPDLRGRTPVHIGGVLSYVQGQIGGVENVTLTTAQLPSHSHAVTAEGAPGNASTPSGGYLAGSNLGQYAGSSTGVSATLLQNTGGGQSHSNLMPYVTVNFVISLYGVFPSRN